MMATREHPTHGTHPNKARQTSPRHVLPWSKACVRNLYPHELMQIKHTLWTLALLTLDLWPSPPRPRALAATGSGSFSFLEADSEHRRSGKPQLLICTWIRTGVRVHMVLSFRGVPKSCVETLGCTMNCVKCGVNQTRTLSNGHTNGISICCCSIGYC